MRARKRELSEFTMKNRFSVVLKLMPWISLIRWGGSTHVGADVLVLNLSESVQSRDSLK